MQEPAWAQVLAVVYNRGELTEVPLEDEMISDTHVLVENTDLAPEEVMDSLEYLESMNLIESRLTTPEGVERDDYGHPEGGYTHRKLELCTKGFDVAHEREQGLRQEAGSTANAFLTGILALAVISQAAVGYTNTTGVRDTVLLGFMILGTAGFFLVGWYGLYQSGIIDIKSLQIRTQRFE